MQKKKKNILKSYALAFFWAFFLLHNFTIQLLITQFHNTGSHWLVKMITGQELVGISMPSDQRATFLVPTKALKIGTSGVGAFVLMRGTDNLQSFGVRGSVGTSQNGWKEVSAQETVTGDKTSVPFSVLKGDRVMAIN